MHDIDVRAHSEIILVRLLRSKTRKRNIADPPSVCKYFWYAFQRPLRWTKRTQSDPVLWAQTGTDNGSNAIACHVHRDMASAISQRKQAQHMCEIFNCLSDQIKWRWWMGRIQRRMHGMLNFLQMHEHRVFDVVKEKSFSYDSIFTSCTFVYVKWIEKQTKRERTVVCRELHLHTQHTLPP